MTNPADAERQERKKRTHCKRGHHGYAAGFAAALAIPKGWRLRRLWNQAPAVYDDNDWMAELQFGRENRYVRNTTGSVGHATPQEALAAACAVASALADSAGREGE